MKPIIVTLFCITLIWLNGCSESNDKGIIYVPVDGKIVSDQVQGDGTRLVSVLMKSNFQDLDSIEKYYSGYDLVKDWYKIENPESTIEKCILYDGENIIRVFVLINSDRSIITYSFSKYEKNEDGFEWN